MSLEKGTLLRVNEPNVVHETIEGEAILLNLQTGNYYSIEWPGTFIWDLLSTSGDVDGIKEALLKSAEQKQDKTEETYVSFVESLLKEELLVSAEKSEDSSLKINEETEKELKKAVTELDKLTLNKYSDMKDMLLLDPIHDVDEKGWPEPKKDK